MDVDVDVDKCSRISTALVPLLILSCSPPPPTASPDHARPEDLLFGGGKCRSESDCASGLCSAGICVGYLMVSSAGGREVLAPCLRAATAEPGGARDLALVLAEVIGDEETDPYLRARAAEAMAFAPRDVAAPLLATLLDDREEPVRFFAGRVLHELGDSRGTAALRGFLQHRSEAVRDLARLTLE